MTKTKYRSYSEMVSSERSYGIGQHIQDTLKRIGDSHREKRRLANTQRLERQAASRSKEQDKYAHKLDLYDRNGSVAHTEHFQDASDNALHYSHYEKHHSGMVERLAEHRKVPKRIAALDLADDAGYHLTEEVSEGSHHRYKGKAGHRRLGSEIVGWEKEEL